MASSVPVPPPRRALAVVATALLAMLALLGAAAPAAHAAPPATEEPAEAAAGWLARQLVDGNHLENKIGGVGYPDGGLTVDAVFAFAAAGVAGDTAAAALTWLGRPANLATYVGNGTTDSYPGALGKTALAAQVGRQDPTAFGSARVDLLARLRALLTASGRFSDRSSFEPYVDYSNALGQSYAVLALERAGAAPPSAVAYLAGSACPGGGFPVDFERPTSTPDTDATGLVVQALLAAGQADAAEAGVGWLLRQQRPDGSFGGGVSTEGPNANSTGLAGQALRVAGRTTAAAEAAAYLGSLQRGCTAPAGQRGAVAYDAGRFDPATAPRATAQAVLGLTGAGLLTLDGTGAAAAAPQLACAAAPTTAPPPTTAAPTTAAPTPAAPTPTTAAPAPGPPPGGMLPATGVDPVPAAWFAVALMGAGTVLLLLARRRRPAAR